jgi:hypothetical protein
VDLYIWTLWGAAKKRNRKLDSDFEKCILCEVLEKYFKKVVKGILAWDFFYFKVVWPNESIWASDKRPKTFSILVPNSPKYWTFHSFSIFLVYEQIHSVYLQYTNRFIPHIQKIHTAKFHLKILKFTFSAFYSYVQVHTVYSRYTNRFIPSILSIRSIHSAYLVSAPK